MHVDQLNTQQGLVQTCPPDDEDPWAALSQVLGGLQQINRWLEADTSASTGADLAAMLSGLSQVDAAVAAATSRTIVKADLSDLPADEGHPSTAAWSAGLLGVTAAEASRACTLALDLVHASELLEALTSGQISRGHAQTMAQSARQAEKDADAVEAARRAQLEDDRRAREAADRAAAEAARTEADRAAQLAAAAEREERIRAEQAAQAQQRHDAARRAAAEHRADLLHRARAGSTPDELRTAAKAQRARDAEAMRRHDIVQHAKRSVTSWIDQHSGMGHTMVKLPPADHDALHTALDALLTFDDPATPPIERRTHHQRRADAAIDLVNSALKAGELPTIRGVKPHLTAIVPLATLTGQTDQPGRTSRGTWLSADTARRLGCDAGLTRAVLGATSQVLDIGRETRIWTVAQYRHAELTFTGCAFPVADGQACARPVNWCDLHHVTYWRNGGTTDIANGVPLCRHHHTAVHHHGWHLTYSPDTTTVSVTRTHRGRHLQRTVTFTAGLPPPDTLPHLDPIPPEPQLI